jgi:Cu-Zn family superoxide dismutase
MQSYTHKQERKMELQKFLKGTALFAGICLLTFGCNSESSTNQEEKSEEANNEAMPPTMEAKMDNANAPAKGLKAYAVINPTQDSETVGVVSFVEVDGGVRIIADIAGLTPGLHGFHIHEHGDCANNADAAGGHYNPTNMPHGGPDSAERHVGDFGNLEANDAGIAHYNRVDKVVSLRGEHSIVGKSVIIHADPDDLTSQPTGNSGKRIACGIIVEAKP